MDINIDKAVDTLFNKFDIDKNGKIESVNKEFKALNIAKKMKRQIAMTSLAQITVKLN
ncbi:MAG: hypothetical protein H7263_14130 [Candidatus Sericytochromatia bacterium]|nr:hypothetical protein [Candidatus Sericytochromatia bacterium]